MDGIPESRKHGGRKIAPELITMKTCPVRGCSHPIHLFTKEGRAFQLHPDAAQFEVVYNDGGTAIFSICKDCLAQITQEKLEDLNSDQIYTWGVEIIAAPLGIVELARQLKWYVGTAVHLRIVGHGPVGTFKKKDKKSSG